MFAPKLMLAIVLGVLCIKFSRSQSDGNIHLLKSEIMAALDSCGGNGESRTIAKEEFERKSTEHHLRNTRNALNTEKRSFGESDSREWDYEDYRADQAWTDPKDDKYKIDSTYTHDRRYVPNQRNSTRNRNSSSKQSDWDNDYYGTSDGDKKYRSIRDMNQSTDLYDPFMTRGIRKKRFGQVSKSDGECLSQCVFANLQIVDDKGIPKEALFIKLIQESITSQQTRVIVESLVQECFRELASESEENECSYSNTLDRCMNLQLKKRKSFMNDESTVH